MAVDDVIFYNVLGEQISRSILVQQMIDFYTLKLNVGETRVTDFNEGSEIRNLLEAFAVDLYGLMEEVDEVTKIAFVETSDGEWLDKHGANPFVNLPRETGKESEGSVVFSIPDVLPEDVNIPEGTVVVSESTGLDFETLNEVVIPVGETSATGIIQCLTVGVDGNVPAGDINLINSDYVIVDELSVINNDACTGGIDYEEDEEYRERLLAFIRQDDFGSSAYYTRICEEVEGVHDVSLVDDETYTKKIVVNGVEKPVSDNILLDVLALVSDSSNLVIGHRFLVSRPVYSTVNLVFNLDVVNEYDDDVLMDEISKFFDGGETDYTFEEFEGLNLGESLTVSKLTDVMNAFEDIVNMSIIDDDTDEAFEDKTVSQDTVFKLGTVTFNQTVIEE